MQVHEDKHADLEAEPHGAFDCEFDVGAPIGASGIKMPPLGLDYFLVCAEQGFDVMLIEYSGANISDQM